MDPLETVIKEKDTSFQLMLACVEKGHDVFYVSKEELSLSKGLVTCIATQVIPNRQLNFPFELQKTVVLTQKEMDYFFIRTDPPFDKQYLTHTWILDQAKAEVVIVNDPTGIRTVNEKIGAMQFKSITPPTLLSSNEEEINAFILKHKKVVIKPTDGFGGKGIRIVDKLLTKQLTEYHICQAYLPQASEGDKRILLLNGKPLGAIKRYNASGDLHNLLAGGKAEPSSVTASDLVIIETIKPYLQQLGLHFVGIDVIGDRLIEINVTSPTCLQELMTFENKRFDLEIVSYVESLSKGSL